MPTMTSEEALAQARSIALSTQADLLPSAQLVESLTPHAVRCTDSADVSPNVQVAPTVYYELQDPARLPSGQVEEFLGRAAERLTSSGWRVSDDRRGTKFPLMSFVRESDDFAIQFDGGTKDGLSVTVSSPCVWPNGQPT